MPTIQELKDEGNAAFKKGDLDDAIRLYSNAVESEESFDSKHLIFGNRAECLIRKERWSEALGDCEQALLLKPKWGKALWRKSLSLMGLGEFQSAYDVLQECMGCEGIEEEVVMEKFLECSDKAWDVSVKNFALLGRSLVSKNGFHTGDNVLSEFPAITWPSTDPPQDVIDVCKKHGLPHNSGAIGIISVLKDLSKYQKTVLDDLSSPEVDFSNPHTIQWINAACDFAKAGLVAGEDPYATAKILLSVKTNAHQTACEGRGGIFRLASKFAHSCSPNTIYQFKDGKVRFTACRLSSSGEMQSFSYRGEFDFLAKSAASRRAELYSKFLFNCKCSRCIEPDYLRAITCPGGCSGKCVRTDDGIWNCNTCKREFLDSNMPLATETKLEASLAELDNNSHSTKKYSLLKDLLLEAYESLGPDHWVTGSLYKRLSTFFRTYLIRAKTENKVAAQLTMAFGAHYLRFLSRTKTHTATPLLVGHFCSTLVSNFPSSMDDEALYQTDKLMTFVDATKSLLLFSIPLLRSVYGEEDSVTAAALGVWKRFDTKLPSPPNHPRDPHNLLPEPPALVGLFAQWEAEVVNLVSRGELTS
eukprot:TRINITY_DN216_c2_g1_i1.p1 TRINITY_DN216_c2_g1~~TRINITY_DN216_c2_g1_i1.p1  ORF type:complete len:587 (+),score=101.70 TRINITY_DN216_c2_g1_i1:43-1803(+)